MLDKLKKEKGGIEKTGQDAETHSEETCSTGIRRHSGGTRGALGGAWKGRIRERKERGGVSAIVNEKVVSHR